MSGRDWAGWPPEPAVLDVVSLIAARARELPDELAVLFVQADGSERRCNWRELDARARSVGARLLVSGADRALLMDDPGLSFVVALVACLGAGVVAIPAPPPQGKRAHARLEAIVADARPDVTLSAEAPAAWLPRWIDTRGGDAPEPLGSRFDPDRVAIIQYTSGATSSPRGVLVDHRNLSAQERGIRAAFRHSPDTRVLTWLPPYHDMGLVGGLLQPLYLGVPCIWLATATFLEDPSAWLRAIGKYGATTSGGPDFAYELCTRHVRDEDLEGIDLSSWRVAFDGSEPVRWETIERFGARFGRWGFQCQAFFPCYGLAEATLMVTGAAAGGGAPVVSVDRSALGTGRAVLDDGGPRTAITSCGRPVAGTEVRILDVETARELPPGRVGEVTVAGPGVARGYLGGGEPERFDARVEGDPRRWLRTGDLGFVLDGALFVTGRLKDIVIVCGRNHYAEDLERTIQEGYPVLRPAGGAVFGMETPDGEAAVVVHEVEPAPVDGGALAAGIAETIAREHGIRVADVALVTPRSLPRTTSGKIRRGEVRRLHAAGELVLLAGGAPSVARRVGEAPVDPTIRAVVAAFTAVLPGGAPIDADTNFFGAGGDSLSAHRLRPLIERRTGITLDVADVFAAPTPRLLRERLAGPPARSAAPEIAQARGALSPAQRRIWFSEQLRPGFPFYHVGLAIDLDGAPVSTVQRALCEVAAEQPALRTRFAVVDGEPRQEVRDEAAIALRVVQDVVAEDLDALMAAEVSGPFDLTESVTRALVLVPAAGAAARLVVTVHHIVCDGWGANLLASAIVEALDAPASAEEVEPPPRAPEDYLDRCAAAALQAARGRDAGAAFWRASLGDAPEAMPLPLDHERPLAPISAGARCRSVLDGEAAARLKGAAARERGTVFGLLLAAAAIVVRTAVCLDDVVLGTVVAQPPDGAGASLVGCYLNFLPLRLRVPAEATLSDLVASTRGRFEEAVTHAYTAFEDIVRAVNPDRMRRGTPLYNVGIWYHDLATALPPRVRERARIVETPTAEIDLRFIVTPAVDGSLAVALEYASEIFSEGSAQQLLDAFTRALRAIVDTPERSVGDVDRELAAAVPTRAARRLLLAANFTIEPVIDVVHHWGMRLALPIAVEVAPYDQVEQQLVSPAWRASGDERVVVIDPDAWVDLAGGTARVEVFVNLVERLGGDLGGVRLWVAAPPEAAGLRAEGLDRAHRLLLALGDGALRGRLVDLGPLARWFSVVRERDPYLDELGRIPFTEGWFAALGTQLFRLLRSSARTPRKVLVLDCDGTLWDGECASSDGIAIPPHKRDIQAAARRLASEGVLLAIASRNRDDDVVAAFAHPEMVLSLRDIAARQVSWRPKSVGLRLLAEELSLELDAFVLVDDDPVVCAEVRSHCPEVCVVCLPTAPAVQATLVDHLWELDRPRITDEDRARLGAAHDEAARRRLAGEALDLAAFIAGLGVEVGFRPAARDDVARVAQITQRANQFNLAATRASETAVAAELDRWWVGEVRDRFGAYGLTCAALLAERSGYLDVDAFVLSCRILGRGVEHQVLAVLQTQARAGGLAALRFSFRRTARNEPALAFLASLGVAADADEGRATVSLDAAPTRAVGRAVRSQPRPTQRAGSAGVPISIEERGTAAAILAALDRATAPRPPSKGAYVAPDGPIEERLADTFGRVLRIDRVGAGDDFFALGGHSLLALKVLWHVRQDFGVDVTLARLYDAPTVKGLAEAVVDALIALDEGGALPEVLGPGEGLR